MNNRLENKFKALRKSGRKALVIYVTVGNPGVSATERIVKTLSSSGADIIELGMPFSDPIADGPVIQASSFKALEHGVDYAKFLALVKRLRRQIDTPLVVMTYYNVLFHRGKELFHELSSAGVDGLIVPDLPLEENRGFSVQAARCGLAFIQMVTPTTPEKRAKDICRKSRGFVYVVTLTGVTGAKNGLPAELLGNLQKLRKCTDKPLCIGFGISKPEHVLSVKKYIDGVIIGSAVIKIINKYGDTRKLYPALSRYINKMKAVL
ncbi:MAG: tryptophan synthase subunit alpha [Elusimicrobiota bacterium]